MGNKTILIILMLIFLYSLCLASQPKDELKNIKKELNIHKKKLEETEKIERNVVEELKRVTRELEVIEGKIKNRREKILKIQKSIIEAEKDIEKYNMEIEKRKKYLSSRVQEIQRLNAQPDPFLRLLMEEDLTKAFRLMRNTNTIVNIDKEIISQYKRELAKLVSYEQELKKLKLSLKQEEESLKKIQEEQNIKKKEKEVLLVQVRQNKALYERKIRELEENARKLTRLLQETEKREKRTGKVESIPDSGFTKRKGTLTWPVNGPVIAHYGNQRDPVFNVPMFRSGIYIKASPGTSVKASAEGKVVYANYFKGYENLVIISHGEGYYTVYGNLGSMAVNADKFVNAGQVIGTVSDKSSIDSPALYFEIRYRGKPLNPELWLKK